MVLRNYCLIFGFLILSACGSRSNSTSANSPPDARVEDISKDYTQTTSLILLHSGQTMKDPKGNFLTFTGKGAKSVYRAVYRFNSKDDTRLKLMTTSRQDRGSCRVGDSIIMLTGDNQVSGISLMEEKVLKPRTNYAVEVLFQHACNEIDFDFDLLAWAGGSGEQPRLGALCEGQQTAQALFMTDTSPVEMFSSFTHLRRFISNDVYCGEFFHGDRKICTSRGYEDPSRSERFSKIGCESADEKQTRAFLYERNEADNTARLQCSKNGVLSYDENFQNCRTIIVDDNTLKQ